MTHMVKEKPGDGFLGWLGRQIGHVRKAVRADVVKPTAIVHRQERIEEAELPNQPGVVLRRTVIDEVIVEKKKENSP